MRSHPIGTGPFKFVEFKPNEVIRVTRNRQYWKTGAPYLDGIEYPIIKNPATRVLAFVSRQIDMIQPYTLTPPLMKEVKAQAPQVHGAAREPAARLRQISELLAAGSKVEMHR